MVGKAMDLKCLCPGSCACLPQHFLVLAEGDRRCKTSTASMTCAPNPWLGNFQWFLPDSAIKHKANGTLTGEKASFIGYLK